MALRFKGDAPVRKRKRGGHAADASDAAVVKSKRTEATPTFEEDDTEGWMDLAEPEAATGPLYITALSANNVTHRVSAQPISANATDDPTELVSVWVCTRVQDSDTKFTLRASTGRYLAADDLGVVSADREARGELEEWELARVEGGYAMRTRFGRYVSVDEVAGGKVELRGDSATAKSPSEVWRVRMQKVFKHEMAKRRLAAKRQLGLNTTTGGASGSGSGVASLDGLTIVKDFGAHEASSMRTFPATRRQTFEVMSAAYAKLKPRVD